MNLWGGRIGAPLTYAAVHKLVGRIRACTGIEFTLHMLRHTHATELIRSGVAIEVVARLLTHRSSTTTSQIYVHLDVADVRAALQRAGVWAPGGDRLDDRQRHSVDPRRTGDRRRGTPIRRTGGTPPSWASLVRRGRDTARFTGIEQPWLRDAVKTVVPVPARRRLRVQHDQRERARPGPVLPVPHRAIPTSSTSAASTRAVLEDFLSWMAASQLGDQHPLDHAHRCCAGSSTGATATGTSPGCPPTPSSTTKRSPAPTTRCPSSSPSS